jgi:uncharacterized protein DUF6252
VQRVSIAVLSCVMIAAATACGGSDKSTGPRSTGTTAGNGAISATINGTAWRSTKGADRVSKSGTVYAIVGVNLPYTISLAIAGLTGPGTVNLNLATGGQGSNAIVVNATGGWGTAFSGGTGTITVTTLTATRIAGTFSFDAPAGSGNATGTLQVRNGTFDVTF